MAPKWLFLAAKYGEEIFFPRKFCLHILKFVVRTLPHTLLIKPIGLQEEVFPKFGSSNFSVAVYTILFTSESVHNYKYFENSFSSCTVLCTSIFQFSKMFISIHMFD